MGLTKSSNECPGDTKRWLTGQSVCLVRLSVCRFNIIMVSWIKGVKECQKGPTQKIIFYIQFICSLPTEFLCINPFWSKQQIWCTCHRFTNIRRQSHTLINVCFDSEIDRALFFRFRVTFSASNGFEIAFMNSFASVCL